MDEKEAWERERNLWAGVAFLLGAIGGLVIGFIVGLIV